MNRGIIDRTEKYVREYLDGVESGHNWWHIYRVRKLAMYIYSRELKGDPFVIEMAALLHDISDYKVKPGAGTDDLENFLKVLRLEKSKSDSIKYVIDHISFRDSLGSHYEYTDELEIVQDADRLDAIGAIGIARAFNYGGSRGFEIYDPGESPRDYNSADEYIVSGSSTINHFYEKLLKIKGMMNTTTGKILAVERHVFMQQYLEYFFREWDEGKTKG